MSGIATPREAVAALNKATSQGRVRMPMALVGSMAAALLCLGGFGAAVYGSGPGDALYGVRGLVFGSAPVTRDVGVELASSELKQVQQLIDEGQWEQAQQKLQTLTTTVATVGDEQRKQELVDQWQQLSVKVENRDPNATVPPDAPPVVLPEVTVTTTPSTPAESPSGRPRRRRRRPGLRPRPPRRRKPRPARRPPTRRQHPRRRSLGPRNRAPLRRRRHPRLCHRHRRPAPSRARVPRRRPRRSRRRRVRHRHPPLRPLRRLRHR